MKKKKIFHILFLIALITGTIYVARSEKNAPYRHTSGQVFGTYYNITYQADHDLEKHILEVFRKIDVSLSMFNDKSTISRINRNEKVMADDMLAYLFPRAMKVSDATGGAFDITVAPLVNAWGFGFKHDKWHAEAAIDSIRQFVGYKKVHLDDRTIKKDDPRIMIDFSAIAKGYASDAVADMLKKAKVRNFTVEIGGEIVVKGKNDKGTDWKIGITKPTENNERKENQCILTLTDCAIATSGNYRNFIVKDGVKYAHTIDPRTGYPVQQDIISSTIVARHCYEADAYVTSFMVTGLEKAKEILAQQPRIDAYFIYIGKDGKQAVWMTEGMKKYLQ